MLPATFFVRKGFNKFDNIHIISVSHKIAFYILVAVSRICNYYIFKNAIENNNVKITNGRFNIPVYLVSTDIDPDKDPSATSRHAINGTWVGPNNYVETRTASRFDQWVFFEPQRKGENGTYYVQPGDWQMDDNGSVRIYWFGNIPVDGIWKPRDWQVLQYNLENGIVRPDSGFAGTGINPNFIIEDPNKIYTNYSSHPEVVVREIGTPLPSLSTEYYTTNTEYYRERITEDREFSDSLDVNSISSAYDYEFDYQEKDSLYLKLGRHTIGDSKNYTVHVRDIQAPEFTEIDEFGYVPEVTIGYWAEGELGGNVTPENPNIGLPAVIDSAGFPFDLNWQVELLEETETSQKFRINYTATDHALSKNQSVASQIVTVDLTTSIKEIAENETAFWIYPNPAKEKLYVSFPSGVITNEMVFEIVNFSGQRIQIPTQCCISPIEIDLSGISKGVYFFRVANGNEYMQQVFIKE